MARSCSVQGDTVFQDTELLAQIRELTREIDKCENDVIAKKVPSVKRHVQDLRKTQRKLETAARELCKENSDLKKEIEFQMMRISTLETLVSGLNEELVKLREENQEKDKEKQRQIDQLNQRLNASQNNINDLRDQVQTIVPLLVLCNQGNSSKS